MFLGGFRNIKVVYVWNIMNLELDETFSIMTRIMRLNASARRQREEKWRLGFFKMTNYRAVGSVALAPSNPNCGSRTASVGLKKANKKLNL